MGATRAVDLPVGVVTLPFTDIEGSTRLLHALGDDYGFVLAEWVCTPGPRGFATATTGA
jgi:class 3 adenylate cyclase